MPKDYSPFTPGVPVPVDFFVGRVQEIQRIVAGAKKATHLNTIERFFVVGERGIGKSSLCRYARLVAEQEMHEVLGLHVYLGGVTTLEEMVRRIFERILRESINKPWHDNVKTFFGKHIRQVDLFGVAVEFAAADYELSLAVSDFSHALKNLLANITPEKTSILLFLDDLNGLATTEAFANWLKSLIDEIATAQEPLPLTLVLVGLPQRRYQLVERQQSLDRVFDIISIERFSPAETREFYQRTFGTVEVQVHADALDLLAQFSGGYPAFMHELGEAIFHVDTDNIIDRADTFKGIVRGAEIIGVKHIEPGVMALIRSERYQRILRQIASDPLQHRFARKDTVARLNSAEAKVFDNFLRRMEELGVIRKDKERGAGHYEFTSELYYQFFWMQASTNQPL
jgi:hypothetical protein